MRLYSASAEETLRARKFVKDWAAESRIDGVQNQRLEQETVSGLRTTNIFLRLVFFFFTVIIVGATVGLFFEVFLSGSSQQTVGIFLLIFSIVCYAAAEVVVSQFRLYRFGIEEALAVFSVGFLCAGIEIAFFSGYYSSQPRGDQFLIPLVGSVFSLWIWHRFGLWYAFLAAMIFAPFLPGYWTSSHAAQHMIVAMLYSLGLIWIAAVRSGHRYDYLEDAYSLAEALLWFGIYLALNLKLSSLDLPARWWSPVTRNASEFSRSFYWATWVLIWSLPAAILARGIRLKDRFVIAVGAIAAILTFICNKPYLGWQRHTWDPMLLGILLTGVALFTRRWLSRGPGGVRNGFTAARLSGKDKHWMNAGSAVLGLISPQSVTPRPQTNSDFRFGGGASGGGGASSDF